MQKSVFNFIVSVLAINFKLIFMRHYTPQVQLIKRTNMDVADEYWLHAVTFCDKTYYCSAGNAPLPDQVDDDGIYHVELKIAQDMELPDFQMITPVVHTINLGNLPFEEEHGLLKVSLSVDVRGDTQPAGSVTVSSTSATKDDRPFNDF